MCSWATVTMPCGRSAAASRLKPGACDQRHARRIARSRAHEPQVGPQAAPRIGVVVGVDEQARQPRQQPRPCPRAGRRRPSPSRRRGTGRTACRCAAAALTTSTQRPLSAQRLREAHRRARRCRPSPTRAGAGCDVAPVGLRLPAARDRAGERQRQPVRRAARERRAAARPALAWPPRRPAPPSSAPALQRTRDVLDHVVRLQATPANLGGRVLGRLAAVAVDTVEVGAEQVRAAPGHEPQVPHVGLPAGQDELGEVEARGEALSRELRGRGDLDQPRRGGARAGRPARRRRRRSPRRAARYPPRACGSTSACSASGLASTVSGRRWGARRRSDQRPRGCRGRRPR